MDFLINIHFSIQSDAISSLDSGVKMELYDYSSSSKSSITIDCNIYPMVIIASRDSSRSDITGAHVVRPYDCMVGVYGTSTFSAKISWGSTYVTIESGAGYFDYYAILGT